MKRTLMLLSFALLSSVATKAQIQLPKKELKRITSDRYIQRTMHLLETSAPEQRNTAKILVYGQSLSAQDWWLDVKAHLQHEFTDANLVMINKAIGGFASQFLIKTVQRDILDYYPDLVIFHVFGSHYWYEEVIKKMRSLTSTEIIIWNDPQNKAEAQPHHENMSYKLVPAFADKYHCAFIDLRTPINLIVQKNNYVYADEFTRDGTHFNEKGCKLIASEIIPHLTYNKREKPDRDGLVRTFEIGRDVRWEGGTLTLPFEGNRVDVITTFKPDTKTACEIYIDNKRPSEFEEAYNHTRPNDNGEKGWIWSVAAPVRIQRKAPWLEETFTLTFDYIDYNSRYFRFHVMGSKSGFEGEGNNREDFISNSGRVFIEANEVNDSIPGDWHVFRTNDVTAFKIESGYETTWDTYLMGTDELYTRRGDDPSLEHTTTLVKGLPNGDHVLKLVMSGGDQGDILKIRIYKPFL